MEKINIRYIYIEQKIKIFMLFSMSPNIYLAIIIGFNYRFRTYFFLMFDDIPQKHLPDPTYVVYARYRLRDTNLMLF